MSKIKDIAIDLCNDQPWDEEWALSNLLHDGEIVVREHHLTTLIKHIEYLIDRSKYYGEHSTAQPVFETILDDLKLIQLGARP